MKKIKELWGRNKVLILLGFILVICIIAILVVTFSFFLGGSKSVYGDRLEDIDNYPISDTFKSEYISNLESNDLVKEVSFDTKGRIIYIKVDFALDTSLDDAKNMIAGTMELFSEDILSYYDINFILNCEVSESSDGFTILGAKNVAGSALVWNNNTPVESEE